MKKYLNVILPISALIFICSLLFANNYYNSTTKHSLAIPEMGDPELTTPQERKAAISNNLVAKIAFFASGILSQEPNISEDDFQDRIQTALDTARQSYNAQIDEAVRIGRYTQAEGDTKKSEYDEVAGTFNIERTIRVDDGLRKVFQVYINGVPQNIRVYASNNLPTDNLAGVLIEGDTLIAQILPAGVGNFRTRIEDRVTREILETLQIRYGLSEATIREIATRTVGYNSTSKSVESNLNFIRLLADLEGIRPGAFLRRSLYHERIHNLLDLLGVRDLLTGLISANLVDRGLLRSARQEFEEKFGVFETEKDFLEELFVKFYAGQYQPSNLTVGFILEGVAKEISVDFTGEQKEALANLMHVTTSDLSGRLPSNLFELFSKNFMMNVNIKHRNSDIQRFVELNQVARALGAKTAIDRHEAEVTVNTEIERAREQLAQEREALFPKPTLQSQIQEQMKGLSATTEAISQKARDTGYPVAIVIVEDGLVPIEQDSMFRKVLQRSCDVIQAKNGNNARVIRSTNIAEAKQKIQEELGDIPASNIVIVGNRQTVLDSNPFSDLRDAGAFIEALDISALSAYSPLNIMDVLNLAITLRVDPNNLTRIGQLYTLITREPFNPSFIINNTLVVMPRVEPMDYRKLKEFYDMAEEFLRAA